MPLPQGEKAGIRRRPASQETGRRRDCARAAGGVYRCSGGEPAGGLSSIDDGGPACTGSISTARHPSFLIRRPRILIRHPRETCPCEGGERDPGRTHAGRSSSALWVPAFAGMTTVIMVAFIPAHAADPRHTYTGTRRHRHACSDARSGHTGWCVGDRPPDHRGTRLQHAGRSAVGGPRHPCQPIRRRGRCGQRVRARHQLRSGAGADRRHADERSVRSRSAVQLRRRYAGRCRADRDHPRTDGGAVRLGGHRRRHQPDHAHWPRTGLPLHRRSGRRLPGAGARHRERRRASRGRWTTR